VEGKLENVNLKFEKFLSSGYEPHKITPSLNEKTTHQICFLKKMRSFFLLLLAVWLLGVTACDEPTEGCLDVEAVNFDVTADRACDDCCTSPRLVCSVLQEYGGRVWKPDTAYQNAAGQWFRVKSISYYLSDFQLFRSGEAFVVEDTLRFRTFGAQVGDTTSEVLRNDFALVRRTAVDYPVGRFRPSGSFGSVQCRLGLDAPANRVVPSKAAAGHPLARQADSLWLSRPEGYVWLQIVLTKDSVAATAPDTLRFVAADFSSPVFFKNDDQFFHEQGFDLRVNLTADYAVLFADVNFGQPPSNWKSQIATKLPLAFRFSK
jgi:hypothetical protein